MHLCRTGQEGVVLQEIRLMQRYGRNVARVLSRAVNLFDLDHRQPGYWEAAVRVLQLGEQHGIYIHIEIFADAQALSDSQRDEHFLLWMTYAGRDGLLWSIGNELYQNGFDGPLDPRVLRYADLLAERLGHRDFMIGDVRDGDDPDASAETIEQSVELAKHCNILCLHSSRKGGATPEPERLRRWVDHLEGFYDVIRECRRVNPRAFGYHREAMGHASQQFVPLGNGKVYEREYDPEVALAAAVASEFAGLAYCYHRIRQQDAGTPGLELIGRALQHFPAGWRYLNDSWAGSPTHGFQSDGGKCRCYVEPGGPRAGVLLYGKSRGLPAWANGYQPGPPIIDLPKIAIWMATRG